MIAAHLLDAIETSLPGPGYRAPQAPEVDDPPAPAPTPAPPRKPRKKDDKRKRLTPAVAAAVLACLRRLGNPLTARRITAEVERYAYDTVRETLLALQAVGQVEMIGELKTRGNAREWVAK